MNETYFECPVKDVFHIKSLYTFFRKKYPRDYDFKGESHDFHEIVCVLNGEIGVTADKNVYLLSAGNAILHSSGEFHALWSNYASEPEVIVFSFSGDELPVTGKTLFSLSQRQTNEICALHEKAQKLFKINDMQVVEPLQNKEVQISVFIKRLELFLLSLFADTIETAVVPSGRSAENYAKIVSVMEEHIADGLSAAEIAELCNISVPSLNKTVAKYCGCGAIHYYNNLRLKKAEELLLSGASVKEAALSVGFTDQNYFSACYKKHKGVSPSRVKTQ